MKDCNGNHVDKFAKIQGISGDCFCPGGKPELITCRGTLHEESWIKSILANGRQALPGDSIQLSDLFKEKK